MLFKNSSVNSENELNNLCKSLTDIITYSNLSLKIKNIGKKHIKKKKKKWHDQNYDTLIKNIKSLVKKIKMSSNQPFKSILKIKERS